MPQPQRGPTPFTAKVVDDHPGKHHEGMELVLVTARCNSHPEPFLSGVSAKHECRGMFNEKEQPLQVIRQDGRGFRFTMSNLGSIPFYGVDHLLNNGIGVVRYGTEGDSRWFELKLHTPTQKETL